MRHRTTQQTVDALAADLKPAAVLWPLWVRFTAWLVLTSSLTIWMAVASGLRHDLPEKMVNGQFLLYSGLLLLTVFLTGMVSLWLALPRLTLPRWAKIAIGSAAVMFGTVMTSYFMALSHKGELGIFMTTVFDPTQLNCFKNVVVISLAPAFLMLFLLRRAACTHSNIASLLAGFSAGTASMVATLMMCANEDPLHILEAHFLPVLLIALISAFLGRLWLRW